MGKLIWIIISVLIIIGIIIVNTNNLNLKEIEDKKQFASLFGKWLFKASKNIKNIVGYSINQDWNITNSTK